MSKYNFIFRKGSVVNQFICAVLINLPMFAYGASIGWMSPMILLLQSKESPVGRPLTDNEISWMASAAYLTCVPTNFMWSFISDRIGRKISLLLVSATLVGCWVVKLSSLDIAAFISARVLVGLNMAGCYVICPVYTKEISQDSIRGFLGSMVVLFQTTGNLFAYIIGDLLSYNSVLWICLALPTFHLILFMMMPESPSYLIKRGNYEEAARVLAWLRCRDEGDTEIKKLMEDIKKEQLNDSEGSQFVLKSILTEKILRRAFIIALIVTLSREICGAIPVLSFAGDIFAMASRDSTLVLTPNQQAMMLGAVQVTGSALASSVVEKAGRKMLLFLTSLVSGLSMFCLASWFLTRRFGIHSPDWIPIVTLCVSIFCDASGLQPVSILLVGEIFSFKYRGTVMATTMATASFAAFLQMLFFKPLATAVGAYVAFFIFAGVCITAAVYVLVAIPETKNKTLAEIYEMLMKKSERENVLQLQNVTEK